ncbi:MAG: hypothetical protein JNJ46_17255 [Myxococcales bacterium]|nr:hypothetical protein [Myxococcales bacterium]
MNDTDFRQQLEQDAIHASFGNTAKADLPKMFDGISSERIKFVRTHMAYAALDAYLMMAVDIYGRKGTMIAMQRRMSDLRVTRGSQVVVCTHYLDIACIGFQFNGINPDAPTHTAIPDTGFPSWAAAWKPAGTEMLLKHDQTEMQAKVREITKFLLAAG